MTYPTATHASEHFTWAELDPQGQAGPIAKANLANLAALVLEPIRAHYGRPVTVTSGYRSVLLQESLYKEAVKQYGAAHARDHVAPPGHSQHEHGRAADIAIAGVAPNAIASHAATLPGVGGVGTYATFVHVDTRPREGGPVARW